MEVKNLLNEYRESLRSVNSLRVKLKNEREKIDIDPSYEENQRLAEIERELTILGGMAGDLEFAIQWIKTGRRPGSTRGAERRSKEQRLLYKDPVKMQLMFGCVQYDPYSMIEEEAPRQLTEEEQLKLDDALSYLSEREREIYKLVKGQNMTYKDAGEYLDISPNTVQTTVERANKKIKEQLQCSLFQLD